jgi:ABC-2 type transport system ATP-binding protein
LSVANPPSEFAERLAAIPGVKRVDTSNGFAIIVDDAAQVLVKVMRLCAELGIEPSAVSLREPTLERVFLHITGRELRD